MNTRSGINPTTPEGRAELRRLIKATAAAKAAMLAGVPSVPREQIIKLIDDDFEAGLAFRNAAAVALPAALDLIDAQAARIADLEAYTDILSRTGAADVVARRRRRDVEEGRQEIARLTSKILRDMHALWGVGQPSDHRLGKLIIASLGGVSGYRADTTALAAVIARIEP